MIRVPDWAFEAAGQEMRGMGQDTAYHPGLYLTPTQVTLEESQMKVPMRRSSFDASIYNPLIWNFPNLWSSPISTMYFDCIKW